MQEARRGREPIKSSMAKVWTFRNNEQVSCTCANRGFSAVCCSDEPEWLAAGIARAPFLATVAFPWKMWSSYLKAGGARAVFYTCKMMYLAKATWFSGLSCYACRRLYPSYTRLSCTKTLPAVLSPNVTLRSSVYSVTALRTDFTGEPPICQLFFHSFHFPVLLISEETLKI